MPALDDLRHYYDTNTASNSASFTRAARGPGVQQRDEAPACLDGLLAGLVEPLATPGARLALVDDFLTGQPATPRTSRWLREVQGGWLANTLRTPQALDAIAAPLGLALVRDEDLTPYLELRRPRDVFLTAVMSVGRHLPINSPLWRSWLGGNALQLALQAGALAYRFLVFEKTAP